MSLHESQIPKEAVNTKEIDSIYKFLSHVDWSEPYLQYLILFHLVTFLCVILTRKRVNFQGTLFVILLATIGCSEMINEYMANNHKKYFKQQYFDSYGMFISLVYSAPVLVNCVIILINWFRYATNLLVDVKQKELKEKMRSADKKND